jgi:predicted negative regulator of RcsB-dependent stress response
VARITRKELKSDKFAQEVGLTVTFFEEHKEKIARYGTIAAVAGLLVAGYVLYQRHEHGVREEALTKAILVQEAVVGASATGGLSFPTQEAKDQEALRVFTDLQSKDAGSEEGVIAEYYLGAIKADQGKLAEAERNFQEAAQKGDGQYASLAKLSLAQIYFANGHPDLGEKTLRDLMAKPTIFVSKEQATIMLAHYLGAKNPAEARKLLEPLRSLPGAVGQEALQVYAEIASQ